MSPTPRKNRPDKAWLREHVTDHWVHEAQRLGYRSRAAFKLLEIAQRDALLRPGMRVVDLGAAPGSWSQAIHRTLGGRAQIVATDLLPIDPLPGVAFVQGDVGEPEVRLAIEQAIGKLKVDLVVSDMAPNLSGVASVDQARSVHLAELALDFAGSWLTPGGDLVVKVFQGEGFDPLKRLFSEHFDRIYVRKPKSSRDRSREVFFVGKGFRGDRVSK